MEPVCSVATGRAIGWKVFSAGLAPQAASAPPYLPHCCPRRSGPLRSPDLHRLTPCGSRAGHELCRPKAGTSINPLPGLPLQSSLGPDGARGGKGQGPGAGSGEGCTSARRRGRRQRRREEANLPLLRWRALLREGTRVPRSRLRCWAHAMRPSVVLPDQEAPAAGLKAGSRSWDTAVLG